MASSPIISVVMPVYNASPFLQEAMESVLVQTFEDFEFIIINDGSTDNSLDIIKSFDDSRIVLLNNTDNMGVIYSLNRGLSSARGHYIARFDADDINLKERFSVQHQFLEENPSVMLCGSQAYKIKENGSSYLINRCLKVPKEHINIFFGMMFDCQFIHPTVMFRSSILDQVHEYDRDYPHAEDYDFWLRVMERFQVQNLSQCLIYYRVHSSSVSNKFRSNQKSTAKKVRLRASTIFNNTVGLRSKIITTMLASDTTNFLNNFEGDRLAINQAGVSSWLSQYYLWRELMRRQKNFSHWLRYIKISGYNYPIRALILLISTLTKFNR